MVHVTVMVMLILAVDADRLDHLEYVDSIFPDLDYGIYSREQTP